MELLLNLAWVLLALPAYWVWRDGRRIHIGRRSSLQLLLSLGCLLVILFPVISATDDLRAMRAEMEESPVSKRSIGQKSGDKVSSWKSHSHYLLALASPLFEMHEAGWHWIPIVSVSVPPAPPVTTTGRAPPSPFSADLDC
jgi:hypothetical protein